MTEMISISKEALEKSLEEQWKEGYRKGNLDGYFGCRDEYKAKFPNEDPYA